MTSMEGIRNPSSRLAVVVTHPIQYLAPLYRELTKRAEIEVLFCHRQDAKGQAAAGFGVEFEWDLPLETGYPHRWLRNTSRKPTLGSFWGTNAPDLRTLLTKQNYDAVWVNGWNHRCYLQALYYARGAGLPVLCRGDSQLAMTTSPWKRITKRVLYPYFLARYAGHLCVGERNREYLTHYGVPNDKIFPVPHFVDTGMFATLSEEARREGRRSELRREWGIPLDATVFLFVGKFIPKKRPLDVIMACRNLFSERDGKNCWGVLVGDGPLRGELEAAASSLHGRIVFAGFRNQSELPACYTAADALILPSEATETWGLVVNEAMACGVPAIVSDACGCAPDMIEEGLTGFSFPCGDVKALAGRMKSLMKLLKAGKFGAALKEKTQTHSVARGAGDLLAATEALIARHREHEGDQLR